MDAWLIWLIVGLVLGVTEIFVLTASIGIIGGAALLTAAFAAMGLPVPLQFIVFTLTATAGAILLRPLVMRHMTRTPAQRFGVKALVGRPAAVVEEVTSTGGRVRIDGEEWTARPYDETLIIPAGKTVDVLEIDGATALVYPRD